MAQDYFDDFPDLQSGFGARADGTPKGNGYFGVLNRADGGVSTELSAGINMDGKDHEIPLLVPTLNRMEIDHLIGGGDPTEAHYTKAIAHAQQRMRGGLDPFAGPGEQGPLPTYPLAPNFGAVSTKPVPESYWDMMAQGPGANGLFKPGLVMSTAEQANYKQATGGSIDGAEIPQPKVAAGPAAQQSIGNPKTEQLLAKLIQMGQATNRASALAAAKARGLVPPGAI